MNERIKRHSYTNRKKYNKGNNSTKILMGPLYAGGRFFIHTKFVKVGVNDKNNRKNSSNKEKESFKYALLFLISHLLALTYC